MNHCDKCGAAHEREYHTICDGCLSAVKRERDEAVSKGATILERLKELAGERDILRAENAALKAEISNMYSTLRAMNVCVDGLKAELETVRKEYMARLVVIESALVKERDSALEESRQMQGRTK